MYGNVKLIDGFDVIFSPELFIQSGVFEMPFELLAGSLYDKRIFFGREILLNFHPGAALIKSKPYQNAGRDDRPNNLKRMMSVNKSSFSARAVSIFEKENEQCCFHEKKNGRGNSKDNVKGFIDKLPKC